MSNDNPNKIPVQKKVDPKTTSSATKATQKPTEKDNQQTGNNSKTKPKQPEVVKHPPSPILSQHKDVRSQRDSSPVTITFLDGDYAGQTLDLGLAVTEISQDQSAEWGNNSGKGIRAGANFNGISTRNFTVKLTFFDKKYDISHLVENLAHLHEIGSQSTTPPTLLWKQGDLRATRVICTSISPTYQHPIGGKEKGFRYAEVELKFQLLGGKASSDALAPPLTSTPLGQYKRTRTIVEKLKQAVRTQVEQLLDPCIGKEGSKQLQDILEHNKQENEPAILALDPNAFIQAAVGGMFSKATLAKPAIAEKLKKDLALVISGREEGVGFQQRKVADALLSGNPSGLDRRLQAIFDGLKADYELILRNIQDQDIGESSNSGAFDRAKNPRAFGRMQNALSCGLNLRNKGRASDTSLNQGQGNQPSKDDTATLQQIKDFFESKPSDEKIKEAFGVKTPQEIRVLKNSAPYSSKEQFISDSSRATVGLTGYNLWSNFVEYQKKQTENNSETPNNP